MKYRGNEPLPFEEAFKCVVRPVKKHKIKGTIDSGDGLEVMHKTEAEKVEVPPPPGYPKHSAGS